MVKYLKKTNNKKGWIDFENEIKNIIVSVSEFPSMLIKKIDIYGKEVNYLLNSNKQDAFTPFLLYAIDQKNYYFPNYYQKILKDKDILLL